MADSVLAYMLRTWGSQWRRIALGGTVVRNEKGEIIHRHIDGYPTSSLSDFRGKIGFGTSSEQHWAEVYTGDGLLVHRAMQHLSEVQRQTITISYGVVAENGRPYPAPERAEFLGMSRAMFFQVLGGAEQFIAGWIGGRRDAAPSVQLEQPRP